MPTWEGSIGFDLLQDLPIQLPLTVLVHINNLVAHVAMPRYCSFPHSSKSAAHSSTNVVVMNQVKRKGEWAVAGFEPMASQ